MIDAKTPNTIIYAINDVRRRAFHRLPVEVRRLVVDKLAASVAAGVAADLKAIDRAIRSAKREVKQ